MPCIATKCRNQLHGTVSDRSQYLQRANAPHFLAPQRHQQTTSLFGRDSLIEELLDIPLGGVLSYGRRLAGLILFPSLVFSCSLVFPSYMLVVVHHMPLLLYRQIGHLSQTPSAFDVLEQDFDIIVVIWSRKIEIILISASAVMIEML